MAASEFTAQGGKVTLPPRYFMEDSQVTGGGKVTLPPDRWKGETRYER